MAYNKAFNPDALPAFAEPERKNAPQAPSTSSNIPIQAQQSAPQQYIRPQVPLKQPQQASHPQQYSPINAQHPAPLQVSQGNHPQKYSSNKPQPPVPTPDAGQYGGGGGGLQYSTSQPGRRLSPQQPPPGHGYSASPPLPNYGFQSPPPGSQSNRPPSGQGSMPQPNPRLSPTPSPNVDPALWPLFKAVDKNGSGQLTERELGAALVNGDWTAFDTQTVRMMIRMFDTDRSGSIGFEEFCGLWGFLAAWRSLFDRFDADRSGNISVDEYSNALVAFGYRLTPKFVNTMFKSYDRRNEDAISFDLFVQSCISLKRMTDVFKKYDDDRDGYITLSFEDFLLEILRQR